MTEQKIQLDLIHRIMVIVHAMEEVTEIKVLDKLEKLKEELND